jgi:6-phosphogluconolactonase (cycloisomerase 2 family)
MTLHREGFCCGGNRHTLTGDSTGSPRKDASMRRTIMSGLAAMGVAGVGVLAAPVAHADPGSSATEGGRAVFVQTNDPAGNSVISYRRDASGRLTEVATVETHGLGGKIANAPIDALASQGSLVLDRRHHLLIAVNAGSNTVSAFRVRGTDLRLLSVTTSRGDFPVSVATYGDQAYVLNAGGAGSIAGFAITRGGLVPLPDSTRSLGLSNDRIPNFITAPSQVGFSPDGGALIVPTKLNNTIEVFPVSNGRPAPQPVLNTSNGAVPFSFVFDRHGYLVVTEAGPGAVSTYTLHQDGTLAVRSGTVPDGGAAVCWIVSARGFTYVSNTGSSTVSAYRVDRSGLATLAVSPTGVVATLAAGKGAPTDSAVTGDERFVYVLDPANGELEGFAVHPDGSLTAAATTTGIPAFSGGAGPEGVAAE